MPPRKNKATEDLIAAARNLENSPFLLRLYVAGMTPRSAEAIRRVTEFCDKHLDERYELEIVDIYQKPTLVKGEQIIAVPTLIKRLPLPLRRFIGDMQSEEKLLFGLDLLEKKKKGPEAVIDNN
jgi:circadian clock protein KaiB